MSGSYHHHNPNQEPEPAKTSRTEIERWLLTKVAEYLDIAPAEITIQEPLKSYGLSSIDAVGLSGELEEWLDLRLSPTLVFDYPSIAQLARYLAGEEQVSAPTAPSLPSDTPSTAPIAIIGMACRFPGDANSPEAFWDLLQRGADASTDIPLERWQADDFYDPMPDTPGKMYTRRGCFIKDIDQFDAHFFGISPREALRMDPQQRLLLEVAWEALENAGLPASELENSQTGVFIGMMNNQEYAQLQRQQCDATYLDDPYFGIGSSASIASGRLPYLLNLHGPAFVVDTACSSSLVALHLASQSLRNSECQLALVGGVNAVILPENMVSACKMSMLAPDGQCKTFDASADGFVMGEGCGLVVLKRLSEALADHDTVLAVIRGSAVNQDGRSNGITAPNRLAQEAVMRAALNHAGIEPHAISYVEAHGSGTALGDPIELEALQNVFGVGRTPDNHLLVGTVKTNIGHLAGAAGIAGLIKTVLSLRHKEIPAHLHLTHPNPHIPWQEHAITIPTSTVPWSMQQTTRLAGISSFGWSGTNAHVILEEAPELQVAAPEQPLRPWQLLPITARSEVALTETIGNLAAYVQKQPTAPLADIAFTLQRGRSRFNRRRSFICRDREDAQTQLAQIAQISQLPERRANAVAFVFPDLLEPFGAFPGELYTTEPTFRRIVDECCTLLKTQTGLHLDLKQALLAQKSVETGTSGKFSAFTSFIPPKGDSNGRSNGHHGHGNGHSNGHDGHSDGHSNSISNGHSNGQTAVQEKVAEIALAQPALFIVEYALAQMWIEWGIHPQAMLGYGLGEYVAACLGGVFTLQDALLLVTQRTLLIQCQTNEVSEPFHSRLLEPLQNKLSALIQKIALHASAIPYISNVTGTWITDAQATDPAYWTQHMDQTVRFVDGMGQLLREPEYVLLEVGPGQALQALVTQHNAEYPPLVLSTLPATNSSASASRTMLTALGTLWQIGLPVNWKGFTVHAQQQRINLPNYPFEHQSYWPEKANTTPQAIMTLLPTQPESGRKRDIADWFYQPIWKQVVQTHETSWDSLRQQPESWLLLTDDSPTGLTLRKQLCQQNQQVITVLPGSSFRKLAEQRYSLRPAMRADYDALLKDLRAQGEVIKHIIHLWTLTPSSEILDARRTEETFQQGFYSLLALAQALGNQAQEQCHITVITNNLLDITGSEPISPEKATLSGPCRVIPQEYPTLSCQIIDINLAESTAHPAAWLKQMLPILATPGGGTLAIRGKRYWEQTFAPVSQPKNITPSILRQGGVYLITGGLGGIGLAVAERLVRTVQARLILVGRTVLPERSQWTELLKKEKTTYKHAHALRQILALEKLGAEILILQADVANPEQMQQVIRRAMSRFGVLHGCFHAAGTPGNGLMQLKTSAQAAQVLHPKVQGTLVLERVLREIPLDFLALFSSTTAIVGSPGQVDYCAANAFLDAYAQRSSKDSDRIIALNWGEWQWNAWEESMAGYGEMATFLKENRRRYGLTFSEGTEALFRALDSRQAQLIVSTQELDELIALSKNFTVKNLLQERSNEDPHQKLHPRPEMETSYVTPGNELERQIASIWEQLLVIEGVGVHDNFFDLGGNSLLGVDLINRMRKILQIEDLPTYMLFEAPSISAMAQFLTKKQQAAESEEAHQRSAKRNRSLKQRMRDSRRVG